MNVRIPVKMRRSGRRAALRKGSDAVGLRYGQWCVEWSCFRSVGEPIYIVKLYKSLRFALDNATKFAFFAINALTKDIEKRYS